MSGIVRIAFLLCFVGIAYFQPIELTSESFSDSIAKGNVFVKFYAPWCGHCKNLAPTWDELSKEEKLKSQGISVAKLDCTANEETCHRQGVSGFPTLKMFKDGKTFTYDGDRTKTSLTEFALNPKQDPTKDVKQKWRDNSDIIDLSPENFDQVRQGVWVLAFYADWCGSCQKLAPVYESVASQLKGKVNFTKCNIDGVGGGLTRSFDVTRVPTIKLFRDGKLYSMEYLSQSADAFIEFIENGYKKEKEETIPTIPTTNKERTKPAALNSTPKKSITEIEEIDRILLMISQFNLNQQEMILGIAAGFSIFILGFILGRLTASPSQVVTKSKKTQ